MIALSYLRAGLCPLPAIVEEKRPLVAQWKSFQEALPSERQVEQWFRNHDAVCLVTGAASGNLELLDFDCGGERFSWWRELVRLKAPDLVDRLVLERSPSGGWHAIYRCQSPICGNIKLAERAVAVRDDKEVELYGKKYKPRLVGDRCEVWLTMIETRGEGGLFLCHPSPGYDLVQGRIEEPPVLTEEEREILLEAAWSLNELKRPVDEPSCVEAPLLDDRPGDEFNERGDVRAVLRHHGWTLVKGGENEYWRRPGKTSGWSATLKDSVFFVFSQNAAPFEAKEHKGYSPFAVYTLLEHNGDYSAAASQLLHEGFGANTQPVMLPFAEPPCDPLPEDPGPFPISLIEEAPDIVRWAMDYYVSCSIECQPILFLASLIAATGAVLGHKVQDRSGLRTNVYTVGILPTGGGKESTRECVFRIFQHAGIEDMCGQEEFASDAGLIAAVDVQNPILFQLDEFGRLMHCVNAATNRNPHLYNIASVLLKFYSKAGSTFRSKAYAETKRNKKIFEPHVCVYGTSAGSNFWSAMNKESLDGGFLPRTLLFENHGEATVGGERRIDPPSDVVDFFRFWANRKMGSGDLECVHPQPMVIPFSADALAALNECRQLQKSMLVKFDGLGVVWSRLRENAGKLAMIHACWRDRERPQIDAVSVDWAIRLATHVVKHATHQAFLCVSESPFHERCQKIMQVVGKRQVKHRQLTRATRSMTPREREEALNALIEQGRVEMWREETRGRPAHWYRAVQF